MRSRAPTRLPALVAPLLLLMLAGCTSPQEAVIVNDGGTKDCAPDGQWQRLVDFRVDHDEIDVEYLIGANASVTVRILDPGGDVVHEKEDAQDQQQAVRRRFAGPAEGIWLVEARCIDGQGLAFAWTVVATGTR